MAWATLDSFMLLEHSATESTKRLCMRRKRKAKGKDKKEKQTEAAFLRRRRDAVRRAASSSGVAQPKWMKGLASKLWTREHKREQDFNREKYQKKELIGFKRGLYRPSSPKEERALQKALATYEHHENKRRRQYILSVEKRSSAYHSYFFVLPRLFEDLVANTAWNLENKERPLSIAAERHFCPKQNAPGSTSYSPVCYCSEVARIPCHFTRWWFTWLAASCRSSSYMTV